MENNMHEYDDEEENKSNDNAEVFLQNDEVDLSNLPPEKL